MSQSRSRSRSPVRARSRSRSRSRSPVRARRNGGGGGGGGPPRGSVYENPPASRCLGIFGLSLYTTERDLRDIFEQYGPLEKIQLVVDHPSGRSRGFGFIYFEKMEDAMEAKERAAGLELDGHKEFTWVLPERVVSRLVAVMIIGLRHLGVTVTEVVTTVRVTMIAAIVAAVLLRPVTTTVVTAVVPVLTNTIERLPVVHLVRLNRVQCSSL
ncbi:hypothetical protein QR680_015152 [Steinernema hermaphroditum]|uniref:RRM domain-containing protein n=1 Tax=Steinernema hermaphroditum TaxID=289476 RepID=A0AA39M533_9BILA|nr:hypothetical protein QR680_015152 [Steinernema hermaphroditum]